MPLSAGLELRTSLYKRLALLVVLVLDEVLDEPACEILCLLLPLGSILVGVTRIEDLGVNAGKLGRYSEVEDRKLLGSSLVDGAVEDRIDDAAGILDGDTLAGSVPAGVYQVSLGTGLLHLLDELLAVLGRMEGKECLSEASGEGRGRLSDSALGSCKLCSEAGEEVVLGLLRIKD